MMMMDCSGRHLRDGADNSVVELAGPATTGLLAALAGLTPPVGLDRDAAQQVGALVKSSIFDRPKAVVLVNVAGVSPDDGTLV